VLWQTHVDQVPEFVTGKPETKAYGVFSPRALNWVVTLSYCTRNSLRSSPQRGLQSTLPCQRGDDAALCCIGKKP